MRQSFKYALALAGTATAACLVSRRRRPYKFRDQVVVIAGGSRGLGLAMARRLASEGARLALIARSEAGLERAANDLRRFRVEVRTFACDLTEPGAIEQTIEEIDELFGRVDVLINNAGIIVCAPFDNQTQSDFEEAMAIHFYAPLRATRAVLPLMRREGGGRILNVSSIGGRIGVPHMSAYAASKHALVGFSHTLAAELHREGIFVTVACPGLMRTGSHRAAGFRGNHAGEFEWFAALGATPLLSAAADTAAHRLLEACREGRPEVLWPWHWRLAMAGSGVLPNTSVRANMLVNRRLPRAASEPGPWKPGREARGKSPPAWYTRSIERAAGELNQA